jgi:hypothetical protein
MLMMSLLLLLLLLQGTGWLVLSTADPPMGRTAGNHLLALVAATKQQTGSKKLSVCAINTSGM